MMRIVPPSLDAAEALQVILRHEKIQFSTGIGPRGPVIDVESCGPRIAEILYEWSQAIQKVQKAL